jgi:hypothetical protein
LTLRGLHGEIFLLRLHFVDEVKEDEVGRTYSTNRDKWNVYRILVGKPGKRDHWEELDVGGKIIIVDRRKIELSDIEWINLAQDKYQ